MRTGRKPKPAALKRLEGNPGKRRIPEEPAPVRGLEVGDAPEWLPVAAREIWSRELGRVPAGVLGLHHAEMYGQYCMVLAEAIRCAEMAAKGPPVVKLRNGPWTQNPFAATFLKLVETARKLASEMGLTPTSAPRAVIERNAKVENPFEVLMGGRGR